MQAMQVAPSQKGLSKWPSASSRRQLAGMSCPAPVLDSCQAGSGKTGEQLLPIRASQLPEPALPPEVS